MAMVEFNPTKIEKTVISIRVETGQLKEVDRLSAKKDISRNEFIVQCINFALANMIDNDKKDQHR